jgi:hypothetical protein
MRHPTIVLIAVALCGCSDVHSAKAARDPAGIEAQAAKLPETEQALFTEGVRDGDPSYLAANPTVADAISEGRRVQAQRMAATTARSREMLEKGQAYEILLRLCAEKPAVEQNDCRARAYEHTKMN